MRNLTFGVLGLTVLGAFTGAFACSAGGKSGNPHTSAGGTSAGGSGAGASGGLILGGMGGGVINGVDGGVVPNDDPTNPNITHPTCAVGACTDFPAQPLIGDGVPANAATLFGAPSNFSAGSLCVIEPQLSTASAPGTMIPANWLRPRFKFAASGLDLFEIRIHSPAQANDLVAYTKQTIWYLPKDIWVGTPPAMGAIAAGNGAANNGAGAPFTVTIRGVSSAAPSTPVGVTGDFNVAPVVATGSMVFWTVNSAQVTPSSSKLHGFTVGDEGVAESLTMGNLQWTGQIGEDGSVLRGFYDSPKVAGFSDGQVRCIGCHTSTPDGTAVVFTDDWPWSKAAASIAQGSVGQIPSYISTGAQTLLKMPWLGTQTMTKAHWMTGDRTLVTSFGVATSSGTPRGMTNPQGYPTYAWNGGSWETTTGPRMSIHQLAWFDLETTATIGAAVTDNPDYGQALKDRETAAQSAQGSAWGLIATGDAATVSDVSPSLSHAGDKIVYTATDYSPDGHPDYTAKTADVKIVPYNNRAGGAAQPLAGASDPAQLEYYPSFSADDKLIAFTRAPAPSTASPDGPYYNRHGEIDVISADGGSATPLAANTPVACGGDDLNRGIINSWPKWSPDVFSAHGKIYYFLIFSSARKYGDELSQQFEIPESSLSAFKGLNDSSQLYLAAIVVDKATGAVETYPALYVWNQNRLASGGTGMGVQFSNLTPAWDAFQLPPLVVTDYNPPK